MLVNQILSLVEGHFQCIDGEITQQFSNGPPRKMSSNTLSKEFVDSPFVHYKFVSIVMSCDTFS